LKAKAGLVAMVLTMLCAVPASALADGSISGSLTDALSGAPVTDFNVCVQPVGPGPYRCGGVAENGEYTISELPADEYRVSFTPYLGNNYVSQYWDGVLSFSDATLVELAQDENRTGIDAVLEQGGELSGTISGAGFGPLEGAWVCATEVGGSENSLCETTDASGHYLIAGLHDGPYKVTVEGPYETEYSEWYYDDAGSFDEADEIEFTPGTPTTIDAELSEAGRIEGTVTGDGSPLEEAEVCALTLNEGYVDCTETDSDGKYELRGLRAGSYVLEFERFGYRTQYSGGASEFEDATPVEVLAGESTAADAALTAPPGIKGFVTDVETGDPLEGVRVCAYSEENGTNCTNTWNGGEYEFFDLPAGTYEIEFEADEYAVQYYDGVPSEEEATPITLSDTMVHSVNAELVRSGSIAGVVTAASDGANLSSIKVCALLANGNSVDCENTDSSGAYEIDSVPVGEYTVRFSRSSYITQYYNGKTTAEAADPVTVTAGETTASINAQMAKPPVVQKPANVTPPVLSGIGKVGEVLTCSQGSWTNNPTLYEYFWARNGQEIHNAEASTYTLVSADAGRTIQCGVLAENSGGWDFAESEEAIDVASIRTLNAAKSGGGTGTVTSSPAGIDCGTTCTTTANQGETITLTATPDAGSAFTGWSGGGCSGTALCHVTLDLSMTVTANFAVTHQLTVSKSGSGAGSVTSSPAGINCGTTCTATANEGDMITLTATPVAGSVFTGWSDGGCSGTDSCQVTLSADTSVTANFTATHNLTVSKSGSGAGSVTSSPAGIDCGSTCAITANEGDAIALTATPISGSVFTGWSGACSGTDPCQVTLDADTSVTANFTATHNLTASKSGSGAGTVTSSPAGIDCGSTCATTANEGTAITLTATPVAGSVFTGWSGGGCSGTDSCQVTLGADTSVTANFTATHSLTVSKAGSGAGSVASSPAGIDCGSTCAITANEGDTITLTATPASGSVFTGWSGGGCSGTGTCVVHLGADTAITANFSVQASGGGNEPAAVTSVIVTPPPAPSPTPKPLKCKKGFKKKTVHGKARCVKVKKQQKKHPKQRK
jgi:hypothetical protein